MQNNAEKAGHHSHTGTGCPLFFYGLRNLSRDGTAVLSCMPAVCVRCGVFTFPVRGCGIIRIEQSARCSRTTVQFGQFKRRGENEPKRRGQIDHVSTTAQRRELERRGEIPHATLVNLTNAKGRRVSMQHIPLQCAEIPQLKTNIGADGKERPCRTGEIRQLSTNIGADSLPYPAGASPQWRPV